MSFLTNVPGLTDTQEEIEMPDSAVANYVADEESSTGTVSTIPDRLNDWDLTGSAEVIDNAIDGKKAYRFDGSSDEVENTSLSLSTERLAVVFVARQQSSAGSSNFYFDSSTLASNGLPDFALQDDGDAAYQLWRGGDSGSKVDTPDNEAHVIVVEAYNSDEMRLEIDGEKIVTDTLSSATLDGFILSESALDGRNLEVDVAELTLLEDATAEDVEQERDRLLQEYGFSGVDVTFDEMRVSNTSRYEKEPKIVENNGGTLMMIARESDTHSFDDSLIYKVESDDGGDTWSSKETIIDDYYDQRNQSLVYDESAGEMTVLTRAFDSNENFEGIKINRSTDDGDAWGSASDISDVFIHDPIAPFGGYAETSNGLMTVVITEDGNGDRHFEAIFSTDSGATWGNAVSIIDESITGFELSEGVPCAVTSDDLMVSIRDDRRDSNDSGWVIVTSDDGGDTWDSSNYSYIQPFSNTQATIGYLKSVGSDIVFTACTRLWNGGSPTGDDLEYLRMDGATAHNDPSTIDDEETFSLYDSQGSSADFGYPTFIQPDGASHLAYAWMDDDEDDGDPNLWYGELTDDRY